MEIVGTTTVTPLRAVPVHLPRWRPNAVDALQRGTPFSGEGPGWNSGEDQPGDPRSEIDELEEALESSSVPLL